MEIELLHEKLDSLKDREIANLSILVQTQSETILRMEQMISRLIDTNDRSDRAI